jgi:hypothetical protein
MKLVTNKSVKISTDEAKKLLTRFVEKKTNSKVVNVELTGDEFVFSLIEEQSDLGAEKEQ